MPLATPFTDCLGVDSPVAQAPVGSATCPALAAAVSEAGGLGSLAVTWCPPEATRRAIRQTRDLTDAPFAVNLALDDATVQFPTDDHLEACLTAGAPAVTFSFGDPAPYVERVHDADALVLAMVGSAADARTAEQAGVDCVVAQGAEAGGHLDSEVSTTALVPRVADAVDVPVLAAGGITDGRGVAAALALGADGAYLGTRFVATEEARSHPTYRELLLDADETATVRTDCFDGGWSGRDHRVLRNSTVASWEDAGRPAPGDRPGEGELVASIGDYRIARYDDDPPLSVTDGDAEAMALYAGQGVGGIEEVEPAGGVVGRLVADAEAELARLDALRTRGEDGHRPASARRKRSSPRLRAMSDSDAPLAVRSRLGLEVEQARLRRRYGGFPVASRTVENDTDYFLHGIDVAHEGWIGVAGAWVSDADDRVLFVRHADAPEEWCLPGGVREEGEGLDGAAAREVHEETGIRCALSGVWRAERKRIVLDSDPERRYYLLDVNFEARYVDGSLELADDDEILEARWFDERPDDVVEFARGKADDWFEA